jgi:hypothetical protein
MWYFAWILDVGMAVLLASMAAPPCVTPKIVRWTTPSAAARINERPRHDQ